MEQHTYQDFTDNEHESIPQCPQVLSFLIWCSIVFICFVATVYFVAFVSVSVPVVTLYLWGACLQAWPSVQPLSLTKIDNNDNDNDTITFIVGKNWSPSRSGAGSYSRLAGH